MNKKSLYFMRLRNSISSLLLRVLAFALFCHQILPPPQPNFLLRLPPPFTSLDPLRVSYIAVFVSLRTPILAELLGRERLASSFGLFILFQGVASIIGSPIAGGWIFNSSFHASSQIECLFMIVPIASEGKHCKPENRRLAS